MSDDFVARARLRCAALGDPLSLEQLLEAAEERKTVVFADPLGEFMPIVCQLGKGLRQWTVKWTRKTRSNGATYTTATRGKKKYNMTFKHIGVIKTYVKDGVSLQTGSLDIDFVGDTWKWEDIPRFLQLGCHQRKLYAFLVTE